MTEKPGSSTDQKDHGKVVTHPRARISLAWLFPLLAVAAATWLYWSHWKTEGPEIEIHFSDAPGIQAGKTLLFYRGVAAGNVTRVQLDASRQKVVIGVRLKAFARELAREGTAFWIDQPVFSLQQTTGLDALIQGNSLQARMGSGAPAFKFEGWDHQPVTPLEEPSLVLRLRARSIPFLSRGAPVYFHGVVVGEVENKVIAKDGEASLSIVIQKEYIDVVNSNSRFWLVPATSLEVGPNILKLDIAGLDALLQGGIEFDTFGSLGGPVKDEAEFELSANSNLARASGQPFTITFNDGRGLIDGQTTVTYLGMPVGLVENARPNAATGMVEATVRLEPGFELLRTEGSIFTLIRPSISLNGVSGLETIIGGMYIAAIPGGGAPTDSFVGHSTSAEEWDRSASVDENLRLTLHAKSVGGISQGAPVFYRGVPVGSVIRKSLDENDEPFAMILVRKEFRHLVREKSKFWRIPGASIEAGPGVFKVGVNGLAALLEGGIAFDDFGKESEPATAGTKFQFYPTESAALDDSPPIRITFDNGQGLFAGRTQLRYLGIPVGMVEEVILLNGKVEVVARLQPGFDSLRRAGSTFAIVRPELSLETGLRGIETLVSGVYIECLPSNQTAMAQKFQGKSQFVEPPAPKGSLNIVVTTNSSTIAVDAPVYYRGLNVGKIDRKALSPDGRKLDLFISIDSQYAPLIRENSRFWDVSGVKATLGLFSINVRADTLESIARGGIAFATPENAAMGARVKNGHRFELNSSPRKEWLRWLPSIPLPEE